MLNKNIIVETDLGHDPDDFFALCYLYAQGVDIKAINLTIGHPWQVAIAKFFCSQLKLNIPIGVARFDDEGNPNLGGINFHTKLLNAYKYPLRANPDDLGKNILKDILNKDPNTELFVIGPPKSTGAFVKENPNTEIKHITFQGGFLAYENNPYTNDPNFIRLEKFENKQTVPTFNLNGAKKETLDIIDANLKGQIKDMQFISKNICHTIIYDRQRQEIMRNNLDKYQSPAHTLFLDAMDLYLEKHTEKKFHDPSAAVCMLHPEIAEWVKGDLYNANGGWGTIPRSDSTSRIIAKIDYNLLWLQLKHMSRVRREDYL